MAMPRRQYRRRRGSSDEQEEEEEGGNQQQEEEDVSKKLEEAKELQKYRKRPVGVSAVGLAFGKKFSEEEKLAPDPFKLKSGGLIDLRELTAADLKSADDEVLQRLSSTFSAETKTRDDEAHMLKYIEEEMSKRKGEAERGEEDESTYEAKIKALYQLPDRLNVEEKGKTEEMLSNQMLSGIPEVDLGLEARFRNIEETELAKHKLIEEQRQKKQEKRESLVPKNMAVNYSHHNLRFYKEKETHSSAAPAKKEEKEQPAYIPVVGENEPELKPTTVAETHKRKVDHAQMATDDFHYDKYRKKARRF